MEARRNPSIGTAAVVLAAVGFATLGILSRRTYDLGLTPMAFVAWRSGVAALSMVVLIGFTLTRGGRLVGWRSLAPRDRVALCVAALAGASLDVTMFFAYARVPVAVVLLCFYLFPAMVAGASALLGWERLDRVRGVALLVALGGMVAVVVGGQAAASADGSGLDPLGVLLAIGSAVSQTVFVLVARRGYREVPTEQAMGFVLVVSTSMGLLIAALGGVLSTVWLPFSSPELLVTLLIGGLVGAGIPSFLFLAGVRRIGGVKAGILMLVQAPVGVALAAVFLDESIGPVQVVGGLAILTAAVAIQGSASPASKPVIDGETATA
ncbi:MAG TPA: DMT family transporter [Candidatus Limnocylindrales bacterium]|nr:DMT family transporter [Candidatus Limnocylindrales bacterium]